MMNQLVFDDFINALVLVDETNDISQLFNRLPISTIVEQARHLAQDPEKIDIFMPILLKNFRDLFEYIGNKEEVSNLLLTVLAQTSNGVTYKYAQAATLSVAITWDEASSKSFFRIFQSNYLKEKDEIQYHFLASLSLEGLVMLPILRGDKRQFVGAVGILLNEFPDIPTDPEHSADLVIKALKLLGRCYDFHPQMSEIAEKVQEAIGADNIAVDTEARFYRGIIKLYEAFSSVNRDELQLRLREARDSFDEARYGHENRSDAELFYSITNCYVMLISGSAQSDVKVIVSKAQDILIERLLLSGAKASYLQIEVEYHMVKLINWLGMWLEELNSSKSWPDIDPPMRLLANVYSGIRSMNATSGIIEIASQSTTKLVLLPDLEGHLIKVQEMASKIERVIDDTNWKSKATKNEIEFFELTRNLLRQSISPKDEAAALEKIRAAARLNPLFVQLIPDLNSLDKEQIINRLLHLLEEYWRSPVKELGGTGWDIFKSLMNDLENIIMPSFSSIKTIYLMAAVQLTVKYLLRVYRANPESSLSRNNKFLFASDSKVKGAGTSAVEGDLEVHLYDYITLNEQGMSFRRQPSGDTSGKPDLAFVFSDGTFFPVEIKRELTNISREHIHSHFIAQAQSYAAGADQVSFLFILDLTPKKDVASQKKRGFSQINIRDYSFVDQIFNQNMRYKDAVVVFIIPANRYLPNERSTYSRGKKKVKQDD